MSAQFLTSDEEEKLCYGGFCYIKVNALSKYLTFDPINEDLKPITASFDSIFIQEKHVLCVFSLKKVLIFAIIFKNESVCKKIMDCVEKYKTSNQINTFSDIQRQQLFDEKFFKPLIDQKYIPKIAEIISDLKKSKATNNIAQSHPKVSNVVPSKIIIPPSVYPQFNQNPLNPLYLNNGASQDGTILSCESDVLETPPNKMDGNDENGGSEEFKKNKLNYGYNDILRHCRTICLSRPELIDRKNESDNSTAANRAFDRNLRDQLATILKISPEDRLLPTCVWKLIWFNEDEFEAYLPTLSKQCTDAKHLDKVLNRFINRPKKIHHLLTEKLYYDSSEEFLNFLDFECLGMDWMVWLKKHRCWSKGHTPKWHIEKITGDSCISSVDSYAERMEKYFYSGVISVSNLNNPKRCPTVEKKLYILNKWYMEKFLPTFSINAQALVERKKRYRKERAKIVLKFDNHKLDKIDEKILIPMDTLPPAMQAFGRYIIETLAKDIPEGEPKIRINSYPLEPYLKPDGNFNWKKCKRDINQPYVKDEADTDSSQNNE